MNKTMNLDRRTLLKMTGLGAFGITGASLLGGCSTGPGNSASTNTNEPYSGQFAAGLLNVHQSNAPYHIAKANGYFEDLDLDITAVDFAQAADIARALVSTTGLATPSSTGFFASYGSGLTDQRITGTLMAGSDIVFITRADSPLRTVKDLKGKKIGLNDPTSLAGYFGIRMLEAEGLDPDNDVTVLNVRAAPDAATALETGVVDVAWSLPPLSTQLIQDGKARVLFETQDLVPNWINVLICTTKQFNEEHPSVVTRWVDGFNRAGEFIRTDTEEAAQIWAKAIDIDSTIALSTLKPFADRYCLPVDMEGLQNVVDAARAIGLVEGDISLNEIVLSA